MTQCIKIIKTVFNNVFTLISDGEINYKLQGFEKFLKFNKSFTFTEFNILLFFLMHLFCLHLFVE